MALFVLLPPGAVAAKVGAMIAFFVLVFVMQLAELVVVMRNARDDARNGDQTSGDDDGGLDGLRSRRTRDPVEASRDDHRI